MKKKLATLLDGTQIAQEIRDHMKESICHLKKKPGLAIILVGDDRASHLYVRLKKKACEECGIDIHCYLFDTHCTKEHVLGTIDFLNKDTDVHGILIQLPLPKHFNENHIIRAIDPAKDVDGFHPENLSLLKQGKPKIIPGLALGILRLVQETREILSGKTAVIVSNSTVFAFPIIHLFHQQGIASRHLSPKNKHLKESLKKADIIVIAVGKPEFLKKSWVKETSIVIDVGINHLPQGKVVGDVSHDVREKAAFLTPVPGGAGPMTVAMLLYNTYLLAKKDPENQSLSS